MLALFVTLQSFVAGRIERDEKGATAVEYGLMVALIGAAIVATVTLLGGQLNALFTFITGEVAPPAVAP
jgi:pilus assembly protein Flp/PilA